MKTLKLNETYYSIPTEWDELLIERYQKLIHFFNNKELEESLTRIEEIEGTHHRVPKIGYKVHLVEIITDIPQDELYGLRKDNFNELYEDISWVFGEYKGSDEVLDTITLDGKDYMLQKDLNNISTGEAISIENSIENDPMDIISIMAILIRPFTLVYDREKDKDEYVIDKFDIKNYEFRKELFRKHLTYKHCIGYYNFFLNGGNGYSTIMKASLEGEEQNK